MDNLFIEKLTSLKKLSETSGFFMGLESLVEFDTLTGLPPKGQSYRNRMAGFIASEKLKHQTSAEAKSLIKFFKTIDIEDKIHQAMIRELKFEYDLNIAVPPEKIAQLTAFTSEAQAVWKKAHEESDYGMFKPYLEKIFNLSREIAEYINLDGHLLNSLAGRFDPGIDVENVALLFKDLKAGIIKLLGKIKNSGHNITDDFTYLKLDKTTLFEFTKYMVEFMGYDAQAGGYEEVLHPVSFPIGPKDARFANNYSDFKTAIFAGIHEAGHGIYMQNSHKSLADTGLWGGISGAMHEGQARFYGNLLGQSRPFWEHFFPIAQQRFKEFSNMDLDHFYRGINKVTPSLKRMTADEVTYSLHTIIRFEIEKDILDEKVNMDQLPDLWNAKYKETFGLEPSNDREGILQDVHWAAGAVGYFQSYALGNLYGGQFLNQLKKDVPTGLSEISAGSFKSVNTWLLDNIHSPSKLLTPDSLIKKVTGKKLSAKYFLEYLNEKYSEIYEF